MVRSRSYSPLRYAPGCFRDLTKPERPSALRTPTAKKRMASSAVYTHWNTNSSTCRAGERAAAPKVSSQPLGMEFR